MIITLPGGVPVRVTVFTSTVCCSLSSSAAAAAALQQQRTLEVVAPAF